MSTLNTILLHIHIHTCVYVYKYHSSDHWEWGQVESMTADWNDKTETPK